MRNDYFICARRNGILAVTIIVVAIDGDSGVKGGDVKIYY